MMAAKIKNIRKEVLHASQEEFGARLGVSRSSVNNWELCTGTPSTIHLIGIAKLSGLSIDYLLSDCGIKEFIALEALTAEQQKIMKELIEIYQSQHTASP